MEPNGWASPQVLHRYGASARSARARRTYDRIHGRTPMTRHATVPGNHQNLAGVAAGRHE
jgi:hypothetical protein